MRIEDELRNDIAVDLQPIEAEPVKIAERGTAAAEFVERLAEGTCRILDRLGRAMEPFGRFGLTLEYTTENYDQYDRFNGEFRAATRWELGVR